MPIYLYVKTHTMTGLKYLGKTSKKDPHRYQGSGKDWIQHLKEHGSSFSTEIIKECQTNEEINYWGRYYSDLWNVVSSSQWANRIPETGGGVCEAITAQKISKALTGRKKPQRTESHRKNLSTSCKGVPKPRTKEHQDAWTKSSKSNWANNQERKKKVSALGKANKGRKQSSETLEKKRQAMLRYWQQKRSQVI